MNLKIGIDSRQGTAMSPSKQTMNGQFRPDNIELIVRARSGDRDAQQEVWHTHRRWVAAIIIAHRPRSVEVDDLMQEVALKIVSKFSTLREPAAFKPWLRQIVINICRGAARSLKPTLRFNMTDRDDADANDNTRVSIPSTSDELSVGRVAQYEAAHKLLDQAMTLPPDYREPLILRCVRSMTYQQISEIMGLPITTIETRLARARRMLREEIGDEIMMEGLP